MSDYQIGTLTGMDVKITQSATLKNSLTLVAENGKTFVLEIDIVANFDGIPEQYHEIFLNMLTSKYYSKTSFGHNPFSQCTPPKNKRWYQFWK
jgi:hypothetical protein